MALRTIYTVGAKTKIAFRELPYSVRKGMQAPLGTNYYFQNTKYMEKVDFITMSGTEIRINKNLLSKEYVEQTARQHFQQDVVCTPCVFGTGVVAVGWRIESKSTAKVIGFLTLTTGIFSDYPADFEYGVTIVVPLSKQWATISKFRVRYINDLLEISKK